MFYNTGWQQYHQMRVNYNGKKFYNIGPSGLYYKSFTIVIYNRNGSTIVEPLL
jgi:hypothetical protein